MKGVNAEWHKKHKMPANPTLEERINWHKAHEEHCNCREMPENIKELINHNQFGNEKGKSKKI